MTAPTRYPIPAGVYRSEIVVINSRFITTIYPVASVEAVKERLTAIRAEMLQIDIEEVFSASRMSLKHVSMDSPVSEGEDQTLVDVMENPNAERADEGLDHHASLQYEVQRSLGTLSQRQKEVICYFFGIGMEHALSLEDIGERFDLTRERVRQIKDKAIDKLKTANRSRLLRDYLG